MAVTLFKVIQLIFENNFNFYIFLAHSRIKMRRSRMDFCVILLMIFNVVASNLRTQIYCNRNYARKNYRPREYPIEHD